MDAKTLAALAGSVAQLNVLYVVFSLVVIAAVATFMVMLGERTLGLDLKRFVDNVEKRADSGDIWPGVVAFFVVPACLLGIVLYLGLR